MKVKFTGTGVCLKNYFEMQRLKCHIFFIELSFLIFNSLKTKNIQFTIRGEKHIFNISEATTTIFMLGLKYE